jgi:2-dehydro-3-deoxyphosphogluconate aldolase/(4S)-4-hydroxy-2-oxoglutarate aldolase
MIPTGGVNLTTASDFILAGAAALGIGGELVSPSALDSGDLAPIVEAARGFVSIVRNARKAA